MSKSLDQSVFMNELEVFLDENVRPELSAHGGNIRILSLADGMLQVRLTGQCSGCPSADMTMKTMVEEQVLQKFPQISRIELINGVSDELIAQAKALLQNNRMKKTEL